MKINLATLEDECKARDWRIVKEDDYRFMVCPPGATVSVVGNVSGVSRMYANGPFDEVVAAVRVIAACDEEG